MEVNVGEWRLYRGGYWSLVEVSGKRDIRDASQNRDIVRDTSGKQNIRKRGIFR